MSEDTLSRFREELNSFFYLVLLNMTFGALAMAFGTQYIVTMVQGYPVWQTDPLLRVPAAMIAMAGFGLGLSWILTSARVLRGIKNIRRDARDHPGPVPQETLTGWIVGMITHFRENRKTLGHMIVICRLGGCAFVTLGIVSLLQAVTAGTASGNWWAAAFPFFAAAIDLTIGLVTILISIGFHRYSVSWDQRLKTAAVSEDALKNAMERNAP